MTVFWELILENKMERDLVIAKNNVNIWQKNMSAMVAKRQHDNTLSKTAQ